MSLFKKQTKPVEVTPKDLLKRVQALEEKLSTLQYAITRIAIVRFNPFKEIGGDQSFSIALLDEQHNGLVITSYYGRELNRVYAKSIENGVSKQELSREEKEAIAQAISSKTPSAKP